MGSIRVSFEIGKDFWEGSVFFLVALSSFARVGDDRFVVVLGSC